MFSAQLQRALRITASALGLYVVWLLLSSGQAPVHGAFVALLAALAVHWLTPLHTPLPRLLPVPGFVLVFLWRSLIGGGDIAWRTLQREMPLHPHWIEYRLRLRQPGARALFISVVSLLPGTLGADLRDGTAHIHSILPDPDQELRRMERWIAAIFSETENPA